MDLLHQTESAINTFYHCQTQDERYAAHQWLLQLQKSLEGWQISWMLLDVHKAIEVQYYGANILHFKIANTINDMEQEQMGELRNKFQQLLCTYSNGPKLVISKLCCVYAAFIIQVVDENLELLQCINDVENAFKVTGIDSKDVILELLTVIPSEFKTLNLCSKQKIIARKFMNDFTSMILMMCNHVLQKENCNANELKHQNDTLNCLLSWVEFGISVADAKDLLPLLFSKVASDELGNKVCEVLVELITSPTSYSAENSVLNFMDHVLKLDHLIDLSISRENHDVLNNLCLLYCNLGETHCRTFLKTTDRSSQVAMLNFVNVILKLTATKGFYPVDESCSELTLNFWYTLQDDLYSLDDLTDYHKQFQKAYVMLVDILRVKCQYPPDDVYEKYSVEDKELLRCYRIDIQDTMLYIYTLLQEKCLEYFCHKLESLFADSSSPWQSFESILHLLRGATESIDADESMYLPRLLSMLTALPRHPKILDSLFFFLGGLSEWFNSHPNEIISMLPFLLQGILNPDTATSCSIALKDICHECALLLSTDAVLEILQTCNEGIHSQTSTLKVVVRLFEIGGFVISVLQVDQMNAQIQLLITPLFQWFKSILQTPNVTTLSKKKIVHYLNCFNGLFRALDPFQELPTHPIVLVFGQLIPLFRVLKLWCGYEEVAVAATNCITKALEVAREKLIGNVHVMSEVLAEFFLTQPYGCVLDASSTLIGMFGAETDCTERIRNLYSLLTTTCIKMVESGEGKNHPDCMQAFMDLSIRVVKTVPEFLYGNVDEQLVLLKSVLILMTYQETPTIKSTCNFIVTYLNFSGAFENSKQVIETVGRDIVVQCLLCISGVSPRHTTDHYAEIMLSFSKHFVTLLATWLSEVFSTDGFPSTNATAIQKEYFQSCILREKTNKRKMKDLVRDFSMACRGLHGMAYAN